MYQDEELNELLQSIAEQGLRLLKQAKTQPPFMPMFMDAISESAQNYQAMVAEFMENPEPFWQGFFNYSQEASILLQEQLLAWQQGEALAICDKRFQSEAWINNPLYNALSRHYLLASKHLNAILDQLQSSETQLAKRIRFFMRQYLDALSPDNFLQTNPEIMAETVKSQGKNLLRGLQNFLHDFEADPERFMITMTDMHAFKLGENLAATPGKVIYKNDMMELIQYTPQTAKVKSTPLLIIPPWINKYYILDLSPKNSLIRWLVANGISVFVLSWVNPDAQYRDKSLEDYLNQGPVTAIRIIQKQFNVEKVNALGFCIGGTLLSMLLAYYKTQDEMPIRSATFLATMIDFEDPGDISVFIDEQQIEKLEARMNKAGFLDGHIIAHAFNSLRAKDLIWSFFIKNYLQGKTPLPFDILYWNSDSTNMPATMHSQYLRRMYLNNDLIKPNQIEINHCYLDVAQIDIPTYFVATQKDHIAPWQTVYRGFQRMRGRKRFLLGGSGHIAGIITPPGSKKYGYYTQGKSAKTPEKWLEKATFHDGSWWPEWFEWLKKESGRQINAPVLNQQAYKAMMDAPGQYVLQRLKTIAGACSKAVP